MPKKLRDEFPIFEEPLNGYRLAYLDNAATTQKPRVVLEALNQYYVRQNANIHRGVHHLSEIATQAFEEVRGKARRFLNAKEAAECIFVRGTTEGINLVAFAFGEAFIQAGDEILISALEHHSNIVPWQLLCQRKSATLKVIPLLPTGELDLEAAERFFSAKTKLLAVTHISNALGTLVPVKTLIQIAKTAGVPVLIDGAQAAPHIPVDVQDLGCDFYVMSSHKMYGPTGVGVLYGKRHWLEAMPPFQSGGDMVASVRFEQTQFQQIPYKFEAGTPAIGEVVGFGAALDFLQRLDLSTIHTQEQTLLKKAKALLKTVPGLRLLADTENQVAALSFLMDDIHPHDIGTIVNQYGVAIRTGHHCAMPVMDFYGVPGTARLSLGVYNEEADLTQLVDALFEVKRIFKRGPPNGR